MAVVEPNVRIGWPKLQGAPDAEHELVERVASCVHSFEQGIGPEFHDRCNKWYRQYRSFSKWKYDWIRQPEDRDGLLLVGKQQWGAHLHIPLSFQTIERLVPAAIAHRPKLLYMPRQERWAQNVESVRLLIDAQQDQIDIDLPFQDVMRSGRIYGLGVGKARWRKDYARRRYVKRSFGGRLINKQPWVLGKTHSVCTFDDPDFEAVSVFDFMWDPMSSAMQGTGKARWAVHRIWLDTEDCLARIESDQWSTASAKLLDRLKLDGMGSGQKYDEVWQERMAASGFSSFNLSRNGGVHELLEWHDGDQVMSVLDREVLVQHGENQCVGLLPFQVYRPTPLQGQMVGIGDLEPLEHLQRELDTLRSQRRDAATIALSPGYIYDEAYIDEEDLVFGPGAAIRVTGNPGPINDVIQPIRRQEVPGTAYEDERVIRGDMDAVSGASDALTPEGASGTATEAQLVQAALSRRIQLSSRRFEIEVVRQVAKTFLNLNQRMILSEREPVRVPDEGLDSEQAAQEGRWRWFPIDPGSLRGEFEIIPEGGSMAARNIQQDRQDAVQIMQMFGQNPHIEPRRPLLKALDLFGIRDVESWLKQTDDPVPPLALELLAKAGVDPQLLQDAVTLAQAQDPRLAEEAQQGPDVQQVDAMMQPEAASV
jgi:hypothetical protein